MTNRAVIPESPEMLSPVEQRIFANFVGLAQSLDKINAMMGKMKNDMAAMIGQMRHEMSEKMNQMREETTVTDAKLERLEAAIFRLEDKIDEKLELLHEAQKTIKPLGMTSQPAQARFKPAQAHPQPQAHGQVHPQIPPPSAPYAPERFDLIGQTFAQEFPQTMERVFQLLCMPNQVSPTPNQVPRMSNPVPHMLNQVPHMLNPVPITASQAPHMPNQVPRMSNQVPRMSNPVPITANQVPHMPKLHTREPMIYSIPLRLRNKEPFALDGMRGPEELFKFGGGRGTQKPFTYHFPGSNNVRGTPANGATAKGMADAATKGMVDAPTKGMVDAPTKAKVDAMSRAVAEKWAPQPAPGAFGLKTLTSCEGRNGDIQPDFNLASTSGGSLSDASWARIGSSYITAVALGLCFSYVFPMSVFVSRSRRDMEMESVAVQRCI
ncbi:hypothetical protein F4678DRAFT_402733 [Xylaria arbuscula]|nr:hypothetical protein F4678DRAFT_402733 [Xylaria arbuscula]